MSLRLKTILAVGFLEAVLLSVLILSILGYMQSSSEEAMEKYVTITSTLFTTNTKAAILTFDLASLDAFISEVLKNKELLYARIIDTQNNILAQGGDELYLATPFQADSTYDGVDDGVFDNKVIVEVDGHEYASIEMGFSTQRIADALDKAKTLAASIAIAEVVLVAFFSFFLWLYLTKQLKALHASAVAVSNGDLNQPVSIQSNDEIGQVAQAFNVMLTSLKQEKQKSEEFQQALSSLNQELEVRVRKRAGQIVEQQNKLITVNDKLKFAEKEILDLSQYDRLTGLFNRDQFLSAIRKQTSFMDESHQCAMLLLSIDHFKRINGKLGGDNADQLLIQVANKIKQFLYPSDILSRLAGDSFAVLLSQQFVCKSDADTVPCKLSQKLLSGLAREFAVDGETVQITLSIGIAVFSFEDDPQNVLRNAEYACQISKTNGRNRASFFDNEMLASLNKRFKLEQDLKDAIAQNKLHLNFQPQVKSDLSCQSIEVLARWQHPQEGFVPPDVFINIAEESNLIISLGNWILKQTCEQIVAWQQQGIAFAHVAVNISPIQFKHDDFIQTVMGIIEGCGVAPSAIMFEITEGVIIDQPEQIIKKIKQLKQHGIKISVDDFGTGYSSLSYLKSLPIDELKIDRSFIKEIESDQSDIVITSVIVSMAQHFGYAVIAEGVETLAQQNILMEKGCHFFQGYYFSRPLPANDIPAFFTQLHQREIGQAAS